MASLGGWTVYDVVLPGDQSDLGGCLAFFYPHLARAIETPDIAGTSDVTPAGC